MKLSTILSLTLLPGMPLYGMYDEEHYDAAKMASIQIYSLKRNSSLLNLGSCNDSSCDSDTSLNSDEDNDDDISSIFPRFRGRQIISIQEFETFLRSGRHGVLFVGDPKAPEWAQIRTRLREHRTTYPDEVRLYASIRDIESLAAQHSLTQPVNMITFKNGSIITTSQPSTTQPETQTKE